MRSSGLAAYVVGRAAQGVVVVWAAYSLTFLMLFLLPSDPVRMMIGPENHVDEGSIAALEHEYGFDRPWWQRYPEGVWHALHGDFGTSFRFGRPVTDTILEALPQTLFLAGAALFIAVVVGSGVAWLAAYAQRPWLRQLLLSLPPLALSLPTFWIGILLLQAFSFGLHVFPARGSEGLSSLVLPAVTLAIPSSAFIAQLLSARLVGAMHDPYVQMARAKGATRARALNRHALRNSAMPALTMSTLLVGWLLSGSVVVETVFSRDGIGRLVETSVAGQDLAMMLGLVTLATTIFVALAVAVDLVHPLIDPRVLRTRTKLLPRHPTSAPAVRT
jgi:peptide/nickel transport system permease protein